MFLTLNYVNHSKGYFIYNFVINIVKGIFSKKQTRVNHQLIYIHTV